MYFTPAVGESYDGYQDCFYVRKGNMVWVHLGIRNFPTTGTQTVVAIGSFPEKYQPLSSFTAVGTGGSGYDVYAWAEFTTQIRLRTPDGYAKIDAFYFAGRANS